VLPIRPVRLTAADLNNASDRERIGSLLAAESNGARSFVLLEGISYYLAPQVLDSLLAALARVQPAGSVLALDYWPLAMEQHEVFTRLRRFFALRFGFDTSAYNLFGLDRLAALDDYRVIESTDVSQQERVFAASHTLQDTSRILWEHYAVLERV
jgi:O-methyltransferase involved in polyketide biosynthesis